MYPYNTLYRDVRAKTPIATRVAVGYLHFYTAAGSDRTFLPGGRCEGVKKADQRWMVEKIDELNRIIESNARRNGFVFANPNPRFDGHELCGSSGDEWIYGLLDAGKFHPTGRGQQEMATAVDAALSADGFQRFTVLPQQKVTYSFVVGSGKQFISLVTGWPGSDVSLTLKSPSGRVIDRALTAPDVSRDTAGTWEHVEVSQPEAGTWTAEMFGVDVAAAGEPVTLSVYEAEKPNEAPVGKISVRVDGNDWVLDASGSTDPDGQVTGHDWYVSTAQEDTVLQGTTIRIPRAAAPERTVTLVVTDNQGATDFVELRMIPVDVKPGSDDNPIQLKSQGVTPVALLSTATFDATTVTPSNVRMGPGNAAPQETAVKKEDVNGDGRLDQVLHFVTQQLKLSAGATQVCLTGDLPRGETFTSCDRIRAF